VVLDYNVNIVLERGDMIVDMVSNEVGLLIERYKVLSENTFTNGFVTEPVWGWRISWSGANMHDVNRFAAFTENGLKNQIIEGRVKLIKVDDT
tara:strand:+ start:4664 stop:4942 length:279 start_codon:yes stop_codon:yes gene_type:complete